MLDMDRTRSRAGSPEAIEEMARMLETLGCDLAGGAGKVRVRALSGEREVRFLLLVDQVDFEKIAGPRGRTAASLRVIVRAAGIKHQRVFTLSIRCTHSSREAHSA